MAWTYIPTLLSVPTSTAYARTQVRLMIGDTNADALRVLEDAEIDYYASSGSVQIAAVNAAQALAAKYATVAKEKKVGDLSLVKAEYERLMLLSDQLRQDAAAVCSPYAGGVSVSDKQSNNDNTDRSIGAFSIGMTDYPGTITPSGLPASTLWGR